MSSKWYYIWPSFFVVVAAVAISSVLAWNAYSRGRVTVILENREKVDIGDIRIASRDQLVYVPNLEAGKSASILLFPGQDSDIVVTFRDANCRLLASKIDVYLTSATIGTVNLLFTNSEIVLVAQNLTMR